MGYSKITLVNPTFEKPYATAGRRICLNVLARLDRVFSLCYTTTGRPRMVEDEARQLLQAADKKNKN
jgi:hypothetical protein